MKKYKNIFIIILSILIVFSNILQYTFISYASDSSHGGGGSDNHGVLTAEEKKTLRQDFLNDAMDGFVRYGSYILSLIGSLSDSNFPQFLSNYKAYKDYVMNDWKDIEISDDGNITIPADLIAIIKQALKEYAEESNGYIILPTVPFSTVTPSTFTNSYQYQTVKSMANEYGVLFIRPSSIYLRVGDVSSYKNGEVGFYISNDSSDYYIVSLMHLEEWSNITYFDKCINIQPSYDKVIHTWDEAESSASPSDGLYYYTVSSDKKSCNIGTIRFNKSGVYDFSPNCINVMSKDGRNILVFKSKEALQNYSVEHRTVYFGSKFYEDSGAVTGTYDDLQDWLDGKYDDFWDKLKDLIGDDSSLSEDDLEKLVDKLMDQLKEVGDKIDEGNKETNNLLQQILNALNKLDATVASAFSGSGFDTSGIEAYLARILADLDYIVYEMEDKTEDELSNDLDNMSDTVMDTFSDLGEVAKTKFPLSIPWDIYNLLTMLGGGSPAPASEVLPTSYDSSSSGFVSVSTYSLDEINTYSGEHGGGGDSHESGNEDGGGGHSRGGYYLSADGDPVFVLPLVFSESMGLGGTINIDMAQFRVLSDISRTLFTLIFAVNLINLTFKAVGLGKDVFE